MIHVRLALYISPDVVKLSPRGWHRSLFDRIGVREKKKREKKQKLVKFDCDFRALFH